MGGRRALAVVGAAVVGAGLGFAAWRLMPEQGGEPASLPPLWSRQGTGWMPVGVGGGELRVYPVRSREECEAARAELAAHRELVLGQNERNLREVQKMRAREADEIGTLYEHDMELLRLERRWWEEQEAKALAWLDAGCPDDGIRGAMRTSPDGEAEMFLMFEIDSFVYWLERNWESLPEWFRAWYRDVIMGPAAAREE